MTAQPLLSVDNIRKYFPVNSGWLGRQTGAVRAVDGVSFTLDKGETLAIVGESGCGKSTVGRLLLGLTACTEGSIALGSQEISRLKGRDLRQLRKRIQVVFQDPFSSLNPRLSVREIIAEPIDNFALAHNSADREAQLRNLMALVGLDPSGLNRRPHEFSGGQRQRIGIARALAAKAEIIICDEAVSALDVSVKAQIVNLLVDLQNQLGVAFVFISHDLAIVENLAQRVAVMYLGKVVEIGDRNAIFGRPHHPYTQALLSSVPVPDPTVKAKRVILKADIPSPLNPPAGCRFNTRCPFAFERCRSEEPVLRPALGGSLAACHLDAAPDLYQHPVRDIP